MYVNGSTVSSTGYHYTDKIPVKEGDVIKRIDGGSIRTICAFQENTAVSADGEENAVSSYVVPLGIDGVILTLTNGFSSYVVIERKTMDAIDLRLSVLENPFRSKRYIGHIGVSQTSNIIIPSHLVFDVSRMKRLGFDAMEIKAKIGRASCRERV